MTKYHSLVGTGSRHALHDLEYPTQADLAAGTNEINGLPANAQRILRLARVQEDSTFYFLMDDDPLTWLKLLTQDDIDTVTLDVAYNNHGGVAGIAVDAGSVTWTLDNTYDFIIDLTSAAAGSRGFRIEETTGSDYIRAETESETGDYINWTAEVRQLDFNSNQYIYLNSEQKIALNATDTDSPVLIGTTSTSGDQGNLVIQATSADGSTYAQVWKDSGAASIATLNSDGDFVSAATISATTARLSDLTDGYIPYHVSDAAGLANSGLFWDNGNTRLGIGTATPTDKLSIRDTSTTGVPSLGAELLTNGAFTSDLSSWTAGANWAWNAGTAKHTAGATATLYQGIATTANEHYYIEVVITGRTAGSVVMTLQNSTESFTLSSNTTYKQSFKAGTTATNNLIFTPTSDFDGAIDSVIAKVVVPASTYAFALYDSGGARTGLCSLAIDDSLYGLTIGVDAARNQISGIAWIAQGYRAGYSNTTGDYWIAQGYQAGYSNTTGSSWFAQGANAGYSNTTGNYWIAQGSNAGYSNTTGDYWIAQGYRAGYSNTTGNYWIAQGYQAARYINGGGANTTCTDFVCIGYDTRLSADGTSNEIVIGTQAIGVGSNSVVLGNSSITTTILRGNTAIGTTDLDGTPAIGRLVVKGSTNDGSTNCLVLRDSDEANVLWIDTDGGIHTDKWLDQDSNTFIGVDVAGNGALTHSAGNDGYMNTGLGNGALYSISTGYSNIGLGYQTLYTNTTSDYNSAMGHRALYYITGGSNTALGAFAGYGTSGSTAANNTLVGYYAGFALQTGGDNNTLLGYSAGDNITTGASNIIIGVSVDAPSATADNQLNIGDALYGDLSVGNLGVGAMPLTNMAAGDLLLEGGSLVLKEITTPTADTNYGKVYTKSDNKLYFQDGGGTEHEIAFV